MIETQEKILELLRVLPASRDAAWEKTFLQMLPHAFVTVTNPEPMTGPDSWPYLFVEITEKSDEPCTRVIEWLTDGGVGMAVNPSKAIPDYVLTYGMLCNYRMSGNLVTELDDFGATELRAGSGGEVFVAEPNEHYLPKYLREMLRAFLRDQKVLEPKVTLISTDKKIYDLAFSIESLGNPPEREHAGVSEALSWFLPAHFGIVLVSEKRLAGFVPL